MAFIDLGNAAAGDGAAEAGLVGHQVGLAVGLARLVHGLARDVLGAVELHFAVIAGWHGAHFVDDVHQHLGAVGRQPLPGHRVIGQHLLGRDCCLHECARVADIAHAYRAAHRDRLEILAAHDRADTGAAGGAVQVVDDCRIQAAGLAGAAYRGHPYKWVLVPGLDGRLGFPDRLAPQPGGVQQFGMVVGDAQVDRRGGAAFEDHHVPAGHLQLGAKVAARVGTGDRPGQRALGDDGIAPAGGGHGAGQRAGGPDDLVLGRQRVDLGIDLLDIVFGCQATLAQVVLGPLHVERLAGAGAGSEVDTQDFSSPRHDAFSLDPFRPQARQRYCPACRPIAASGPGRSSWRQHR